MGFPVDFFTPTQLIVFTGFFGLLVGSFLNVVIYRLPIMMERGWRTECQEFLGLPVDPPPPAGSLAVVHTASEQKAAVHTQSARSRQLYTHSYLAEGSCTHTHCVTQLPGRRQLYIHSHLAIGSCTHSLLAEDSCTHSYLA